MSPIVPSRFCHPKYNVIPQKTRSTNQRGVPGTDPKSRRKQRVEVGKLAVEPTEDYESDNFYSKQLAAARFQRNHQLINVLFSDNVVMLDNNITDKLQANKKRLKSLTDFQKKLDDEIVDLNQRFNAKKAKLVEDRKIFIDRITEIKDRKVVPNPDIAMQNEVHWVIERLLHQVVKSLD